MDDFRATLCTADQQGNRKWVYPTIVAGALRTRRQIVAGFLILNYLMLPWIVIRGEQAVRLDIAQRRFVVLGLPFYATDTVYLFLLIGTAAFSLFLFTALFGRVWCGWGCPQTVFLEFIFRPIERLIEGNEVARRRLDRAPWTAGKLFKKSLKIGLYSLIAWVLSSTLLAYFVGREPLLHMMASSPADHPTLFAATLAFMGVLLFQFGWFREQFCSILCPYARFQSVLMDPQSLSVAYDGTRGEPRGKGTGTGDCVDCGLCVRVCPAGIDIRNGLQLECVQCASCIDACNSVMVKINRPQGLVRYATDLGSPVKGSSIFRPRVLLYAAIIGLYISAFTVLLTYRRDSEFQVIRIKTEAPFTVDANERITNHFKIHLANKSRDAANFTVRIVDAPNVEAVVPVSPFTVAADMEAELPLFIRFGRQGLVRGATSISLEIQNNGKRVGSQIVPLIGPEQ